MNEKSVLPAGEAVAAAISLKALVDSHQALADSQHEAPTAPVTAPVAQPRIKPAPVVSAPLASLDDASPTPPPPTPAPPVASVRVKFIKLGTPADTLIFKDGTRFNFPLIERNGGAGFSTTSEFTTSNATLIANLRDIAGRIPAYGVKEVK